MEPIAIVGIGCRFPGGASSPALFWQLLLQKFDAITEIPPSRFPVDDFYDARPATPAKMMTRWGGFLDDIELLDADFWELAPREADRLDPQQRLLMEVAWEALEDAGQLPNHPATREAGVFMGVWLHDYESRLFQDPSKVDFYMTTGSGRYSLAGRLSYLFGFQGPSLTVDCACSSSLVAVHLACQSLRQGECQLALAGGVNVILQPQITIAYSQSRMMAPDGRCKFGSDRADGYVRSEGAGVIVLKRLTDALAAQDPIYALIRGSAVNNDGRSSGFLTTPGGAGQEDLLRKAYQSAGVMPAQIQYVEAHGTGTRAGDPVEIQALGAVLNEGRTPGQFCRVGSVKTNLGHTEGAAGIAGLIKVALALKHKVLPASLHFDTPNPEIPWAKLPIRVQSEATPWPDHTGPALAGVSAFGIAGTNAHVVLEEAPAPGQVSITAPDQAYVLPLSARNAMALSTLVQEYRTLLAAPDAPALADLCYTASVRRTHHDYRAAFVANSRSELDTQFLAFAAEEQAASLVPADKPRRIVFVFPGQGGQWVGMGRSLLQREAVFRAALERCDRAMRPLVQWSVIEELEKSDVNSRLDEIDFIQPALFAIQVALAALWRAWGIEPAAVVGHSMGEVAAAHVAGALSLDDAVRIICRRSQLMREVSGQGAMAAVDLPLIEAQQAAAAYTALSVAVNNSPRATVVAGDPAAVQELMTRLQAQDVFCRRVKVDIAAHSPQMEPLRPRLIAQLAELAPVPAQIPFYSTVSGHLYRDGTLDAEYWGRNLREPVLFASAIQAALADGYDTFIELSPHPVVSVAIQQNLDEVGATGAAVLTTCRRNEDEQATMLRALGELYVLGQPIDWTRLFPDGGRFVSLPTYPWQRERFWLDNVPGLAGAGTAAGRRSGHRVNPLLGWPVACADNDGRLIWENELDATTLPALFEHRLGHTIILPAAAYLGMALAAARSVLGDAAVCLRDVVFHQSLVLTTEGLAAIVQTSLTPTASGYTFRIHSQVESGWRLHVNGQIHPSAQPTTAPAISAGFDPSAARWSAPIPGAEFYHQLRAHGIEFGTSLHHIATVWSGRGEALARLNPEPDAALHWLNACFQITPLAISTAQLPETQAIFVPVRLAELHISTQPSQLATSAAWSYVSARTDMSAAQVVQDLQVAREDGTVMATLHGLQLVQLGQSTSPKIEDLLYTLAWQPLTHPTVPVRPVQPAESWLILSDTRGVGAGLAAHIRQQGGRAVLIFPGAEFCHPAADEYRLDPADVVQMQQLFQDLFPNQDAVCQSIVVLWGLDETAAWPETIKGLEAEQARTLAGTLHLIQAAAAIRWQRAPKLWLVTQGVAALHPTVKNSAPVQAMLWGLGRVIGVEYPDLWGGLIDLAPGLPAADAVAQLWPEFMGSHEEDQVALADGQRFTPRLVSQPPAEKSVARRHLTPNASYLITGGLGGLGLQVANCLVEQGARHLVLMGRTSLPPRLQWSTLDPETPAGQKVAQIRALEAQGAHIHLAVADVADEGELTAFLDRYRQEGWPPLKGVIHAAGVIKDRLLGKLTWAEMQEVLRAKVSGGWLLHNLLPDLDFFVLFSSIGSLLGQPGQGNYAAANAFLDALAHQRHSAAQLSLAINWGPWAGLGFASSAGGLQVTRQLAEQGIHTLEPIQGTEILAHLLKYGTAAQVAVLPPAKQGTTPSPASLPRMLAEFAAAQGQAVLEPDNPSAQAEETHHLVDDLLNMAPPQRKSALTLYIQQTVARILRSSPNRIGVTKPLGTLGMDSLMTLEFRNRLEADLGLTLSATFVWNYPTVRDLVPYLAACLGLSLVEPSYELPSSVSTPLIETSAGAIQTMDALLVELEQLSDDEALNSLLGN